MAPQDETRSSPVIGAVVEVSASHAAWSALATKALLDALTDLQSVYDQRPNDTRLSDCLKPLSETSLIDILG